MDKLTVSFGTGLRLNSDTALGQRLEETCPETAVSCVDHYGPCCIPDMGKMTLALQWAFNRNIEKFTIHGFWPGDCSTGMAPETGCGVGAANTKRDLDRRPQLKQQMDRYWVSSQNNNQRFWDHEWNKHGTCLSTVRDVCPLGREEGPPHIRYFKATLREYEQFDVYEELKKNKVVPRLEPYPKTKILEALKKWDMTYRLQCLGDRLNQIYFYRLGKAGNQFIPRLYYGTQPCPTKIRYLPKLTSLDISGNPITPRPAVALYRGNAGPSGAQGRGSF